MALVSRDMGYTVAAPAYGGFAPTAYAAPTLGGYAAAAPSYYPGFGAPLGSDYLSAVPQYPALDSYSTLAPTAALPNYGYGLSPYGIRDAAPASQMSVGAEQPGNALAGTWASELDRQVYPGTAPLTTPAARSRNKKVALVVGITYVGTRAPKLMGTSKDIAAVRALLVSRGYKVVILSDDPRFHAKAPTRKNITAAMLAMTRNTRAGDSLFFFYSGHGHQTTDVGGDEWDKFDETIIPCDFASTGEILDDDLYYCLCHSLPAGVRLNAVMDCCHSGTGLDLPFSTELPRAGGIVGGNKGLLGGIGGAIGGSLLGSAMGFGLIGTLGTSLAGSMAGGWAEDRLRGRRRCRELKYTYQGRGVRPQFPNIPNRRPQADIVLIAASHDSQTAAEDRQQGGMLTNAYLRAVGTGHVSSLLALLQAIEGDLSSKNLVQHAQLSASKPFDLNSPYYF